jgi:uncharacterized membrane protein (UPF0136 family)
MAPEKRDTTRANITFAFVIILGLIIGIFIKRVSVGLVIGLALGLLGSGLLRRK